MSHLKVSLGLLVMLVGLGLRAAVVHVITEQSLDGGEPVQLGDVTLETGGDYETAAAPVVPGYIFTHWSSDDVHGLMARDAFGRSYEKARYHLYQNVTMTAHYLPVSRDTDRDGVPDGYEIYWYGNLNQTATSDTDDDGYDFAAELAAGTSPLMPDRTILGGMTWLDSVVWLYNPNGYPTLTVKSDPEGVLFETTVEVVKPGMQRTERMADTRGTSFAYWTLNGGRVADAFGRSADAVIFTMPEEDVVLVAHCIDDQNLRAQYYWYGKETSLASDTDGDGFTLAEELKAGTSPLMSNRTLGSGVKYLDSDEWFYNPNGYPTLTVRSDPEGVLFETTRQIVKPGEQRCERLADTRGTSFAYWTLDGERMTDAFGRSVDAVAFTMPMEDVDLVAHCIDDRELRAQYYWYGKDMPLESDTDGDGYTFAQELAAGTNPLMKDRSIIGGVEWKDSDETEMNLQPYERVGGFVVNGKFLVPELAGRAIWPIVADVNGDGLFDVVIAYKGGARTFVNVGGKGNPEFEERVIDLSAIDLEMNSPAKLATMLLDVEPVGALSATTWGEETLLVSDSDGRIWYYRGTVREGADRTEFVLQHKVWGGSFAGFANGLRLAAVDWDDDGDLDCLCGTAEGKLMLLRDPKVGRPTNVKALVGIDNVKLVWDPNQQSRIRGYRLYRKDANDGKDEKDWSFLSSPSFESLGLSTTLPTYRDYPPEIADFDYRITSLSRHYVAGNSTPIESESMPTETVRASMGKVGFLWSDAAAFVDDEVRVKLGVENSLNLSGEGLSLSIAYDADDLQPVRVETSGLTEGVTLTDVPTNDQWTVSASGGEIAAGGGTFVTFVFRGLRASTNEVALVSAVLKSVGGATVSPILPEKNARIEIWARQPETPTDPRYVGPYGKWDMNGDGWLTWEDRQLMAQLMQGGPIKKYTDEQLRAGDDNGNEELDNHDFQQMKADFDALGIKNNEDDKKEAL